MSFQVVMGLITGGGLIGFLIWLVHLIRSEEKKDAEISSLEVTQKTIQENIKAARKNETTINKLDADDLAKLRQSWSRKD